jgi:HrpA-like RNA helicase
MEEASTISGRHVKIVVAQPRRIAAIGVATRVHEEMGEESAGISMGTKGSKVG